jgi:DNA-binding CsgD family transcriptional regulator
MLPSNASAPNGSPKAVLNSLRLSALHPLSLREGEVLEWVASGKRNGEIGSILNLSPRTVEKHVQHIMEKLGVETRTAAGNWWHERLRAIERATTQKPC